MTPRSGSRDEDPPKPPEKGNNPQEITSAKPVIPLPLAFRQETKPNPVLPFNLSVFLEPAPGSFPINVPPRLVEAFRVLEADPVLSGGSAVQVWTGRTDGIFGTRDLDFITHLRAIDLETVGIERSAYDGRYAVVDGIPVEFPSGPLGVGDLDLDPRTDTVHIPTMSGNMIRCIRPEACVLDRLALVANDRTASAFLQASAVLVAQIDSPIWDQEWIDQGAKKARLGLLWNFLAVEVKNPSAEGLEKALQIGWDPLPRK